MNTFDNNKKRSPFGSDLKSRDSLITDEDEAKDPVLEESKEKELEKTKAEELKKEQQQKDEADKKAKESKEKDLQKELPPKYSDADPSARRRQALNRSEILKDKLYKRDHSELAIDEFVQLIVVERVSWIGSKLFGDEAVSEADLSTLESEFDYLVELSDKIANPDIDVSPEVQDTYIHVLELSARQDSGVHEPADHSHDDFHNDIVLSALAGEPHDNDGVGEDIDDVEHDHPGPHYGRSARIARAITSLAVSCVVSSHSHSQSGQTSGKISDNGLANSSTTLKHSHNQTVDQASPSKPKKNNFATSTPTYVASQRLFTRPNSSTSGAAPGTKIIASKLALSTNNESLVSEMPNTSAHPLKATTSLVVGLTNHRDYSGGVATNRSATYRAEASKATKSEPNSPRTGSVPNLNIGKAISNEVTDEASHQTTNRSSELLPFAPDLAPAKSTSPLDRVVAPQEKVQPMPTQSTEKALIESLSIGQLLKEAEKVPLGHGRYLKDAYNSGEIDKEGLIKVIKDWNKGIFRMPDFVKDTRKSAISPTNSIEQLQTSHTPILSATPDVNDVKDGDINDHSSATTDRGYRDVSADTSQTSSFASELSKEATKQTADEHEGEEDSDYTLLISIGMVIALSIVMAAWWWYLR